MKKINYPLIVSDFDGTLLRSDGTIREETKKSIEKYVNSGGIFVLSSGRMTPSIVKQAKALSLTGLVGAYNGAEVVDISTGERIFSGCLPQDEAISACEYMQSLGLTLNIYDGDEFYSNHTGALLDHYEKVCQVTANVVKDMPLSEFIKKTDMRVVKIVVMTKPEDRDLVYERLEEKYKDKYLVVRSAKYLVELCDKRYSKGTALAYIAGHYKIPLSKTIAVGDNENDLSMLERAGLGFSVANGEDSIKGKIAFLPDTNDENAVGKLIEKYAYYED